MTYRNDAALFERAMEAGIPIDDLFDECPICDEFVFDRTCGCTYAYRLPTRVRLDPWSDAHEGVN